MHTESETEIIGEHIQASFTVMEPFLIIERFNV